RAINGLLLGVEMARRAARAATLHIPTAIRGGYDMRGPALAGRLLSAHNGFSIFRSGISQMFPSKVCLAVKCPCWIAVRHGHTLSHTAEDFVSEAILSLTKFLRQLKLLPSLAIERDHQLLHMNGWHRDFQFSERPQPQARDRCRAAHHCECALGGRQI